MFGRNRITSRVIAALVATSVLALGQVGSAASASAHSRDDDGRRHHGHHKTYYPSSVATVTGVWADYKYACARVSSGAGTPRGSVSFYVSGRYVGSAGLSYGKACVRLPRLAPGTYQVAARFNGDRYFRPSWGSTYLTVKKWKGYGHHDDRGYRHSDYRHHGDGYHGRSVAYRPAAAVKTARDLARCVFPW